MGGQSFSKLNFAHSYQQLLLDESSKRIDHNPYPQGVVSIQPPLIWSLIHPLAVFQQAIEDILQGLEHVSVYLDDILLTGRTEEHLSFRRSFKSSGESWAPPEESICAFMLPSIKYLGYIISN